MDKQAQLLAILNGEHGSVRSFWTGSTWQDSVFFAGVFILATTRRGPKSLPDIATVMARLLTDEQVQAAADCLGTASADSVLRGIHAQLITQPQQQP